MKKNSVSVATRNGADEANIKAVVIRCGCNDPLNIHPSSACPEPLREQDLGIVSYWHRNPLRRGLWMLKQSTKRKVPQ